MKIACVVLLTAILAAAQSKTDWANVKKLAPGDPIRVSMTDGKSYRGNLQSVTDDSLIVTVSTGQETLARAQVAKVGVKGASHRGRNTLIGLGVGAGAGVAIGAGVDSTCHANCWFGGNIGKEVFTPLGAIIGTVVGVAWPTGGWKEVYRAK
jgi:hypothetical protein